MQRPPPPVPLVALAAIAYVGGAFIGFAEQPVFALFVVVGSGAFAAVRRRLDHAGLAVALAAGVLVASAAARDDRACIRQLRLRPELERTDWQAVLDASAAPGAYTPARLVRGRCTIKASLAVKHGAAAPGATVRVTGTATVRGRRVVVIKATIAPVASPGLLARWRGASERAVDRIFVRDRALA
nr:hypothetical protein [Gemmatimonadaceae bacterium]